jgi:two-component system, sensor histidine kinase and response regulator
MQRHAINYQKLLAQFQGSESLASSVAKAFLDHYPLELDRLQAALQRGDATGLKESAHSLKGALANLFAEEAMSKASELERLGASGSIDEARGLFESLKSELDKLRAELLEIIVG